MYPPAGLPKDMVEPTIGGSDYWANKVRMQYRKTNPEQVCAVFVLVCAVLGSIVCMYGVVAVTFSEKQRVPPSFVSSVVLFLCSKPDALTLPSIYYFIVL